MRKDQTESSVVLYLEVSKILSIFDVSQEGVSDKLSLKSKLALL